MIFAQGSSTVDWITLLQTFGLAVVILIAIGLAIWRLSKWTGKEVVIPLRDQVISRFLAFLSKIENTVSKLDTNVDRVTNNLEKQTTALEHLESLGTTSGALAKITADSATSREARVHDLFISQEKIKTEILSEISEVKAFVIAMGGKLDTAISHKAAGNGKST